MSQVSVWKSDEDGKLFEDHQDYLSHLRLLSRARATVRTNLKIKQEHEQHCLLMGQVKSISELHTFLIDNWHRYDDDDNKSTLEAIQFSVKWQDRIANTHSCPRGGITNWGQNKSLTTGYAGWHGRLTFAVTTKTSDRSSSQFEQLPIHSGTGGCSSYAKNSDGSRSISYAYDVILWADDFPALFAEHEKSVNWVELGGVPQDRYLES